MDKNQLQTLLTRYTQGTAEEVEDLVALQKEYPYSQLFYVLSARIAKDTKALNPDLELQKAAIHASDRTVLKEIITSERELTISPLALQTVPVDFATPADTTIGQVPVVAETIHSSTQNAPEKQLAESKESQPEVVVSKTVIESIATPVLDSDVADELMRDLEKLNSSKHNFEMLLVEYSELKVSSKENDPEKNEGDEVRPEPKRKTSKTDGEHAEASKTKDDKEQEQKKKGKPAKSKRQRIIELARSKNAPAASKPLKAGNEKTTSRKSTMPTETLIENIATSKKEVTPENPKQKEQMAIINQFIKAAPTISSAKERPNVPVGDLNPIKSGEFGDNIVSETLVEILIKQGKKDKAVEVLKKLIWKYPQKKAYFASQIEDLKK